MPDFGLVDCSFGAIGHSEPCNPLLNFQMVTKLLLDFAAADLNIDFGQNYVVRSFVGWRVLHYFENKI